MKFLHGFLHEGDEFGELLRIVAASRPEGANAAVVEKDYWVTHTLWALQRQGFALWFKGGTSLSKGFGLLQRFSEDLDLALEPGTVPGLERVTSWRSTGKAAIEKRRAHFAALEQAFSVPDCELVLPGTSGRTVVDRVILVRYPARFADRLPRGMRAHVQLELGRARVEPALERDLDSWVHAFVRSRGRCGVSARATRRGRLCCCQRSCSLSHLPLQMRPGRACTECHGKTRV